MNQIYVTNNINQNLDLRILTFITEQISHIDRKTDYLQVFDLEDYVSNHTEFYIADDILELMEQIHRSGNMDEVIEMFTIKY